MRFNEAYVANILLGKKTASIRSNVRGLKIDSVIPFTANGRRFAKARIKEIRPVRFQDLSEEDAKRDGFENLQELREGLSQFYKKLKPNSRLFAVRFQVVEKT
ncbi:MAG TPA: ASCH domain-containing protein [Candidatus Bathyarchaeia archaeon]|nr:ASCH domain-containing protein [Candidatus Bathyarchaeia archaeon]